MAREKKKIKICHEREIDRLSDLPDSIIHDILSFMDTKYAVQTSVLSKRWNNLWIHLPSLNFNSKFINRIESFQNLVLHVLNHHEASNLHSLSLLGRLQVNRSFLDTVINYAVSHHVQHLNISFASGLSSFYLPSGLLNCQSLRILKMANFHYHIENLTNSLVFASLTTLHLQNVSFYYSENNCIHLFSNCVNLENLILAECSVDTHVDFIISGPQLVNLSISNLRISKQLLEGRVMVSAPRLTSFNFAATTYLRFSVDSCPNLDTVNIHVYDDVMVEITNNQDRKREYIFDLINIFQELSNAKSLTLSLDTIKVLSMVPGLLENQPSPFNNLKSLKVKVIRGIKSFNIPLHVMNFLLHSSPNVDMVVDFSKA